MSFEITHELLLALSRRNLFAIPEEGLVFFGLRGCLPADPEDVSFARSRTLKTAEVNYFNPRCTLGQWSPQTRTIAVYPGSTCPSRSNVERAAASHGAGANQLLTGYYSFEKGLHHADKPSRGHRAFRQEEDRVVLRNADDLDFDFHDVLSKGNQSDNLHCGFSAGLASGYSSAGCQVVVGMPSSLDGSLKESGPWAAFRQTAYGLAQNSFRYILWKGSEVEAMAQDIDLARPVTLRFGSQGELVRQVQQIFFDLGLISFVPDANCGPQTQMAVVRFQISRLGAENADGILGANTAAQLSLRDWPTVGKNKPVALDGRPFALDPSVGTGVKPKGADSFRFHGDYKLPGYAIEHFNAEAGVPWDGAEAVPDWNEYSGCVPDSGYAFPHAPVPALFYEAKFAIDADGLAPEAGTDPTGAVDTNLHDANNKPLDSRHYPFIVLPLNQQMIHGRLAKISGRTVAQMGAQLGDLGVALFKNGQIVPVIYGDRGPAMKLGEGSVMVAKALGINADPERGGIDEGEIPPGIVHVVFPGSNDAPNKITKRSADDVARDALALFKKFRTAVVVEVAAAIAVAAVLPPPEPAPKVRARRSKRAAGTAGGRPARAGGKRRAQGRARSRPRKRSAIKKGAKRRAKKSKASPLSSTR